MPLAERLVQLEASVLLLDLDGEKAETAAQEMQGRHEGKAIVTYSDAASTR